MIDKNIYDCFRQKCLVLLITFNRLVYTNLLKVIRSLRKPPIGPFKGYKRTKVVIGDGIYLDVFRIVLGCCRGFY